MKNQVLKKTYNKIAKDWNSDHLRDDWWIEGADIFSSFLPKDSFVIDIGCAGGYKTEYLKQKGFSIEGIDFSEGMIYDAKKKFPNIDFKVFDVYDLDNLDKTYDGIFCQAVLLHIPKKNVFGILEKMKKRLKNSGLLYIAVKEKKENGVEEEIKKEDDYGYEYERFFSYYSLDELKKYFKDLDMEIVYESVVNSGRSNWINIIVKK
ncbi:MAG: class I SAM-dependent methyltransferase [Patescibacteria group bacterium]